MVKKGVSRLYLALIFCFLYLPIAVLVVLSFNRSKSHVVWTGFTLDWYAECFRNQNIMSAFATTLEITFAAAVLSTIIGTLAAIGISAMKRRSRTIYLGATNIPLLNADIVTGISMMLLFVRFTNLGFVTVLIAHITFNIPYVILNVLPRLKQASRYTYEAALDLGAGPLYAFFKVTWPEILPGVFSGFLMAVTMSLDDFSITYFTKGAGINTLSTMLYAELRKGIRPELYALSTVLFFTVLLLLIAINLNSDKTPAPAAGKAVANKGAGLPDAPRPNGTAKQFVSSAKTRRAFYAKRAVCAVILVSLAVGSLAVLFSASPLISGGQTITVLNYGQYFDEDALRRFEEETGIRVNYEEYDDPEEMYTKYKAGAIDYDVICTSEYMIEKLIQEGEVLELDFSAIPNYAALDPNIIEMTSSYDPEHKYTVPYFYGTLGILYNTKLVDAEDVKSWDCLWNGKYAGSMIMTRSVRDAFAPALITLGYSINDTDKDHLLEALEILKDQNPDVSAYYVDETRDEMIAENAAIGVCYSGDAGEAMAENENLAYSIPEEGSNLWIDSWFMPKTCKNQEAVFRFLDYVCRDDVAQANFDYVYYTSPNRSVAAGMDAETRENEAVNPSEETIRRCEVFRALSDESAGLYNTLWQELISN